MEKKNTSKIQENGKAVNAWIIGILIIQLILSIFILFQLSSTSSVQNNTDNIKIENIKKLTIKVLHKKITCIFVPIIFSRRLALDISRQMLNVAQISQK